MYDPAKVFTAHGYEEYKVHLFNLKAALFFILNNADDLHIEATEDGRGTEAMDVMYKMKKIAESDFMLKGDGEVDED
jgi:hypothetical protein